jgi:hypothetical protein
MELMGRKKNSKQKKALKECLQSISGKKQSWSRILLAKHEL